MRKGFKLPYEVLNENGKILHCAPKNANPRSPARLTPCAHTLPASHAPAPTHTPPRLTTHACYPHCASPLTCVLDTEFARSPHHMPLRTPACLHAQKCGRAPYIICLGLPARSSHHTPTPAHLHAQKCARSPHHVPPLACTLNTVHALPASHAPAHARLPPLNNVRTTHIALCCPPACST